MSSLLFFEGESMSQSNGIRLVAVDLEYIQYLHKHGDTRVQFNPERAETYQSKPYVGVLFFVSGLPYFAPLESRRPSHLKLKENPHIVKINGGRDGIIGLNNMIPIPKEAVRWFNIYDYDYADALKRQFVFCSEHKAELRERAEKVYQLRKNPSDFVKKVYCDFEKLEKASYQYCLEKGYTIPPKLEMRFGCEKHISR